MRISFFEEFSTKSNLEKLKLVSWPTKVYLAAKSLEEFNKIKKNIKDKNIEELVYWPVLDKREGYWISPFSRKKALLRIFKELKDKKISVMLDLEFPTRQNFWLYLIEWFNFFKNKRLIEQFIQNYNGQIYLAEYYPEGKRKEELLQWLGLHYNIKNVKVIKMYYHSLHNFSEAIVSKELQQGVREYGDDYQAAFGTIAMGIHGNEPILPLKQLKIDLQLAKQAGVKEAVIFRLGGLNKKYAQIINQFV